MNEVHHLFKQVQLILSVANTSAYDNALPGLRLQGRRDERLNIVTAVEAKQAGLSLYAVLCKPGHSDLNGVRHWLGVPRPRHPERIESDNQHTRGGSPCVHV